MEVEEGQALLEKSGGSAAPAVPGKDDRCNPCRGGFWRYHFGADALLGAWLLLIGSALWMWMEADNVAEDAQLHNFAISFSFEMTLTSAGIFVVGSAYFVYLSYPEKMQQQMESMQVMAGKAERGELSWVQRYFTASEMLMATWSFVFAFTPFIAYGLYAVIEYPSSSAGYVEILVAFFGIGLSCIWAFAAMPENVMKNEGRGSTYCHDSFLTKWWCCGGCCASDNWKSDMLVGLWMFTALTFLGIPYAVWLLVEEPTELYAWIDALMILSFLGGMGLFTYSAYPENFGKSTAFDLITCSKAVDAGK